MWAGQMDAGASSRDSAKSCAGAQLSVVQGLRKTCMYCGDGINDLIALGAADVGMTVGSSDASAAATISNRNSSIAGDGIQPAVDISNKATSVIVAVLTVRIPMMLVLTIGGLLPSGSQ